MILIGAIEAGIELRYQPGFWQRSTYLLYDPYRGEPFDRAELAIRLGHAQDDDPDIISVGDSSGFFSLQPTVVNRYLHGRKYVDLNTGANHAFDGYYGIAEYMLRRSRHIRYVVLYMFPTLLPQEDVMKVADLGPITRQDLDSVKARLTPPSAFLSPYAKFEVFEGRRFHADEPLTNSVPVLELTSTVDAAQGWLPEFDIRYDRIDGRLGFYSDRRTGPAHWLDGEPSAIVANLNSFYRMVRSYGADLVIAFGPMPRRSLNPIDPNLNAADRALAEFQQQHPDVKFLFPLVALWGPEKFGMYNHISREYTFLSSKRIGEAFATLLERPDAFPPYVAEMPDQRPPYAPIVIKPIGPPDPKLLDPALALFRYTTSLDEVDWQLVSARDQQLLANEPAFDFMIEDAQARKAMLAARGMKLGFDMSQLRATPVSVDGLSFCDPRPDLQWVQVDGSMIFKFDAQLGTPPEPVAWPQASSILLPTIIEDGVRKFDGYCPEASASSPLSAPSAPLTSEALLSRQARAPWVPAPAPSPPSEPAATRGLFIQTATYGASCGVEPGNAAVSVRQACDGKAECDYEVDVNRLHDPAPRCGKDFSVEYMCAPEPKQLRKELPAEAGLGSHLRLTCPPDAEKPGVTAGVTTGVPAPAPAAPSAPAPTTGLSIQTATYGASCGAEPGNATMSVGQACNGKAQCDYVVDVGLLHDPAPQCGKDFSVEFNCAPDPKQLRKELPAEAGLGSHLRLTCQPEVVPPRGLYIESATYGGSCGVKAGNATVDLGDVCDGKSECDYVVDVNRLHDPAPRCGKDFSVEYMCAPDPQQLRKELPVEAGLGSHLLLSCPHQ